MGRSYELISVSPEFKAIWLIQIYFQVIYVYNYIWCIRKFALVKMLI